eukprot:jgi/Mesen1/9815/ME000007S09870
MAALQATLLPYQAASQLLRSRSEHEQHPTISSSLVAGKVRCWSCRQSSFARSQPPPPHNLSTPRLPSLSRGHATPTCGTHYSSSSRRTGLLQAHLQAQAQAPAMQVQVRGGTTWQPHGGRTLLARQFLPVSLLRDIALSSAASSYLGTSGGASVFAGAGRGGLGSWGDRGGSSSSRGRQQRGGAMVVRAVAVGPELAGALEVINNLGLDTLTFLVATVLVVPAFKAIDASPILGFLLSGVVLSQFGLIRNVTDVKALSELGILFLLFEMGLELSLARLKALAKFAFGMGLPQVLLTTLAFTAFELPPNGAVGTRIMEWMLHARPDLVNIRSIDEAVVIGAALSLSSSAFVLQLLAEKGELPTRIGSATLGILLLQDIAVVPLLVILPILETGNFTDDSLFPLLAAAGLKSLLGLGVLLLAGRLLLRRFFEAFVAMCLLTVTGTSLLTQRLGFSDSLGAFLAGALLAETNYRTQVEADIRPFRGLLLGLFFVTTGTSVDFNLLVKEWPNVLALLGGLIAIKTSIITVLGPRVGLTFAESLRTGMLLSQGGEFAFVVFSLANQLGVLPLELNRLLIIVVVLSMALTPALDSLSRRLVEMLESKNTDVSVDDEAARKLGFRVLYGDGSRPAVLETAGITKPKAVMVMYAGTEKSVQAVERLRNAWPSVPIYARAKDLQHMLELRLAGATEVVLENAEGLGVMRDDVVFLRRTMRDTMDYRAREALINRDYNDPIPVVGPFQAKVRQLLSSRNGNATSQSLSSASASASSSAPTSFFSSSRSGSTSSSEECHLDDPLQSTIDPDDFHPYGPPSTSRQQQLYDPMGSESSVTIERSKGKGEDRERVLASGSADEGEADVEVEAGAGFYPPAESRASSPAPVTESDTSKAKRPSSSSPSSSSAAAATAAASASSGMATTAVAAASQTSVANLKKAGLNGVPKQARSTGSGKGGRDAGKNGKGPELDEVSIDLPNGRREDGDVAKERKAKVAAKKLPGENEDLRGIVYCSLEDVESDAEGST